MNKVTKWIGISMLALSPIMASAQNQQGQPVTPFNNAAVIPNNAITMVLAPNQIGTTLGISDVQFTAGARESLWICSLNGFRHSLEKLSAFFRRLDKQL